MAMYKLVAVNRRGPRGCSGPSSWQTELRIRGGSRLGRPTPATVVTRRASKSTLRISWLRLSAT